jgi:imidazolonepropionase-like amidohydrolase
MRTGRTVLALGIFALLRAAPNPSPAQTPPESVYAITGAKIFILAGDPIDNGTLIIRDGKIAAVGVGIQVPAGAQIIDAKGLQVYPGLFDPVTQMGLSEIAAVSATVDDSELGSFNPNVVASEAILPSSEHILVTRAAGITEVLAAPASGGFDARGKPELVGGQASAIHLGGWTIGDMLIKKSAAMVVGWPQIQSRPADSSKGGKSFADAKLEYDKQVQELSDWIERARHYALALGRGGPPDYQPDLKLEALVPVTRGELPLLIFAAREREIRAAVNFCDQRKLKMILAGGEEAYKVKDLLRSRNVPVILRPTLTEPLDEDDPYDRFLTQPSELAAAGVKFAFGSFDNSFSRRLGQQAANAVAYGLPYDIALKAVSKYPAEIFGLGDQLGTLESGKVANVIVTDGDPLELTTNVKFLFIKGQLTSTNNKQKSLYEKYSTRPKAK